MAWSSFASLMSRFTPLCGKVCQLQKCSHILPCSYHSFKYEDLEIRLKNSSERNRIPDAKHLAFGKNFSDHMLEIEWTEEKGWSKPLISPMHDLVFHPASKVLHYAQELFEGMKAFKSKDGRILLFRPEVNMERMLKTAERASLPNFDGNELLKCVKKLITIDEAWIPKNEDCSLYIRPTLIGIEPTLGIAASKKALLFVITGPVGAYFSTGAEKAVSLFADPVNVRSWPGGVGDKKMGCNYAPTLYVQKNAEAQNHQQVLWLYGEDHTLVEVGTMNIFIYMKKTNSEYELVTPPLDGLILPGVTRKSLLDLARKWGEFQVSERHINMKEIIQVSSENRLLEIFGAGTACVVCPVGSISYMGKTISVPTESSPNPLYKRFSSTLKDIQYGRLPSEWSVPVE